MHPLTMQRYFGQVNLLLVTVLELSQKMAQFLSTELRVSI